MNDPEQEWLIETLVEQYRGTLCRRLPRPVRTITKLEDLVQEVSREVDRQLKEAILDRQQDPEALEAGADALADGDPRPFRGSRVPAGAVTQSVSAAGTVWIRR